MVALILFIVHATGHLNKEIFTWRIHDGEISHELLWELFHVMALYEIERFVKSLKQICEIILWCLQRLILNGL